MQSTRRRRRMRWRCTLPAVRGHRSSHAASTSPSRWRPHLWRQHRQYRHWQRDRQRERQRWRRTALGRPVYGGTHEIARDRTRSFGGLACVRLSSCGCGGGRHLVGTQRSHDVPTQPDGCDRVHEQVEPLVGELGLPWQDRRAVALQDEAILARRWREDTRRDACRALRGEREREGRRWAWDEGERQGCGRCSPKSPSVGRAARARLRASSSGSAPRRVLCVWCMSQ
jgi:hypothetical protein